jgi:hypothetical protein
MTGTTTPTTAPGCISEPISWLRLEQFASSRRDAAIGDHVAACPACRACLDEIERDVVALPPLAIPEMVAAAPRRRWWTFAVPAGLALAAAAILLLVLRPRDAATTLPPDVTQVKGIGRVELDVVRERAGVTRDDVRTYAPGDRWKVVVTCASDETVWADMFVVEAGATRADYPLGAARIACGNQIPLPGAFAITGDKANDVCVRLSTDGVPPRIGGKPGDPDVACVTLVPDQR